MTQVGAKIDEKSMLRAFYVEVFFQHPKKSLSEPSRGPLGEFFNQKSKILEPKTDLKNYGIAGVVASCALFKTLLNLVVSYGFVWGAFWCLMEATMVPFGGVLGGFWRRFAVTWAFMCSFIRPFFVFGATLCVW